MRWFASLLTFAVTLPTPESAQQAIKLSDGKPYRHKPTKLTVPDKLAGIERDSATALTPDLDEAVSFTTPDDGESITIYVFRRVSGSVPVWADRIAAQILTRPVYGGATPTVPIAAFFPPNQANASGLIASYTTGKPPYRASGFAIMPLGPQWYVALRYSSATLDPTALDGKMREVIAAIDWPDKIAAQADAAPVQPCTTPLALSGMSEPVDEDQAMQSSILGGLIGKLSLETAKKGKESPAEPTIWCRDAGTYAELAGHGVYRAGGATDRYLIAIGDAGTGVSVFPDALALALNPETSPSWSITVMTMDQARVFTPRDRLPPPGQILSLLNDGPRSTTTTWGKKNDVNIFVK